MAAIYDEETARILAWITNREELLKQLREYCFHQSNSLSVHLFGLLFFEENPLVSPFFVWNTIAESEPLLETEKIPWKKDPRFRDTVKIDRLNKNSLINEAIKSLTGFSLKSVVIVPLFINNKVVGALIAGNRSRKRKITEGEKFLMEMASIQVSEVIKKTVGLVTWEKARLLTSSMLDYRINKLHSLSGNPDIMVSILQIALKLRRLMVVREDCKGGAQYYYAEIDETGNITHRETGPFTAEQLVSDLVEKIEDDNFIKVPILKNKKAIGFLLLTYKYQGSIFNEAVVEIIHTTSLRLSEFLI